LLCRIRDRWIASKLWRRVWSANWRLSWSRSLQRRMFWLTSSIDWNDLTKLWITITFIFMLLKEICFFNC
jgi:hypothetical protein